MKPSSSPECIQVVIRCRPLSLKEINSGFEKVVHMFERDDKGEILVHREGSEDPPKQFTFDRVFDENTSQEDLFEKTARAIVGNVIEGYNGTIFAYGQTGTGKTHTMEGETHPKEMRGIISRCFETVYNCIEGMENSQFLVRASYLEIYKENIRDLLSAKKQKLIMHEKPDTGVYIKDLSSYICKSCEEMQNVQDIGKKHKSMAATSMNDRSSRSHSVFTLTLERSEIGPDGKDHIRVGKLNMVDLAGSERQSKTDASGQRLEEAIKINLSLTCLCQVISALTDSKATYVPYRDSQLTRLLQDSLGGNTKTVMISNIGPADYNMDETINTLRWASRAKNIQNRPRINEDPKDAMIREFQDEIRKLRAQLEMIQDGKDPTAALAILGGKPQIVEKVIIKKDEKKLKELEEKLLKEKEEIKRQAEEERMNIEQQMNMAEDEKKRVIEKIRQKEEEEEKSKTKQQMLIKKLKKMEEKVVVGEEVKQEAKKQAKELKKTMKVLEKENNRRAKLEEQKKVKDDELLRINKKFGTLQEELDYITKKLHKVWSKYTTVQNEIQENQDEFYRDRQDIYDTIFELDTQLKLKSSIIENFIPEDEVKKVIDNAKWSEELNDWILKPPKKFQKKKGGNRPVSAVGMKRPTSEYSRIAKGLGDINPRFKFENILDLDLDMPERTTEDYQGMVAERVQSAINMILSQNEEESVSQVPIEQLINFGDSILTDTQVKPKVGRPKSAKRIKSAKKKGLQSLPEEVQEKTQKEVEDKPNAIPRAKGLI
jgi:kinesin family member 3B